MISVWCDWYSDETLSDSRSALPDFVLHSLGELRELLLSLGVE
jgi:hypothetical protein